MLCEAARMRARGHASRGHSTRSLSDSYTISRSLTRLNVRIESIKHSTVDNDSIRLSIMTSAALPLPCVKQRTSETHLRNAPPVRALGRKPQTKAPPHAMSFAYHAACCCILTASTLHRMASTTRQHGIRQLVTAIRSRHGYWFSSTGRRSLKLKGTV
jgi:hypothetical protein